MRWAEQCSSHSQWGPRAEGAVSCPHKTALTHLRRQPDSGGSRPPGLLTNCLQIWGFPPPPLVQSFARISRRTPESTTLMIVVLPCRTSPGRGAQGEGRQGLEGTASAPSGATPGTSTCVTNREAPVGLLCLEFSLGLITGHVAELHLWPPLPSLEVKRSA